VEQKFVEKNEKWFLKKIIFVPQLRIPQFQKEKLV
jgi:hypothetical protein